jgi:hypothetical protein
VLNRCEFLFHQRVNVSNHGSIDFFAYHDQRKRTYFISTDSLNVSYYNYRECYEAS